MLSSLKHCPHYLESPEIYFCINPCNHILRISSTCWMKIMIGEKILELKFTATVKRAREIVEFLRGTSSRKSPNTNYPNPPRQTCPWPTTCLNKYSWVLPIKQAINPNPWMCSPPPPVSCNHRRSATQTQGKRMWSSNWAMPPAWYTQYIHQSSRLNFIMLALRLCHKSMCLPLGHN